MKFSLILKAFFFVLFLLFINSCATDNALIQTQLPDIPAQGAKASIIQKISFIEEENYTRILVAGSENISPPFYKLLSDPLRIVIDVPNIDLKEIKDPLTIDNGTIGKVLSTQYDDKGRIEISLVQMANYNISKEDKNLIIDIEKLKTVAEAKEAKKEEEPVKEKEAEKSPEESKKEETLPPQTVVVAPAASPEPMNKAKEIINFLLEEKKDFVTFNIVADGKIENYNSFKLDSPARLVLDILEIGTRYPKKSVKIKNSFIKEVRIGQHPDKVRLVFDSLKSQLPPYQINRIDDKLIVSIGNVPQLSEPQIYVQEKSAKEAPPTPAKLQPEGPPKSSRPSTLTGIDFKQMNDKSRIVLSLSAEDPQFESSTPSKNTLMIDVKNAFAPKRLVRGLDTSAFETVVRYIDLKNVKVGKANDIQVLIKLGEETPYETTKEGKEIFVDIKERPKKIVAKVEAPAPPKKEEVVIEPKEEEVKKEEEKPIPEVKKPETVLPPVEEKPIIPQPQVTEKGEGGKKAEKGVGRPSQEKIYTGRKLSLDFKDADIKNILRLIAEVSNLNIITGDDVTGKITMRLVDVPWDQALDVILQARSLGMSYVGNVIRIAPLETMKKEKRTELEEQRALERSEELMVEAIPVNYAIAKDLILQIKSTLGDRGDVRADERTNTLIVKDIAKKIARVKDLVKSIDAKTPQILIEARLVEANLTFQRELGVQWGILSSTGTGKGKTNTVGGMAGTPTGGTGSTSLGGGTTTTYPLVNLPAVPQGGIGGGTPTPGILEYLFTSKYGLKELDIQLSAHENRGDVKIISSPKIATLDNKEASMEQGLRIPYRKLTTEGTITTDFIDANLKLTVTPHVIKDGNIKMIIKAKKDAADWTRVSPDGVPAIDKKEAISEVLVNDNGVAVIAGVYSIEKDYGVEGVPLFGKIPLLGWLFKREVKQDLRKDLLIFISPKIIKDQL